MERIARVLTIAGSDSGGGAGIQADLKAITVLGGYGMSVITALTAQNTLGVHAVHAVPVEFIGHQLDAVLSDIGADVAKTGMLATPEIVRAVAEGLRRHRVPLLVVDPVMVAKSGDSLLSEEARRTIQETLFPVAHVVTPNLPEAAVLCGFPVRDMEEMREAARRIHQLGPRHVVVKGGHLEGDCVEILFDGRTFETFHGPRLNTRNTHGTGCTFSAALATLLAQGRSVPQAVAESKAFVTRAIGAGLDLGSGHGPTHPYVHVLRWKERETVLRELAEAIGRLEREPIGHLIPEVRSNLGYAVPGAMGFEDVAAIPGRITQVKDRVVICRAPAFGASRHIAKVILAAMGHDPEMRAAMNIRYEEGILRVCRGLGLRMASFDRREEPKDVKEREGSSLEWGTHRAIQILGEIPELVYDTGDMGKEPMIRILGKNPREVADKIIAIGKGGG
jgi:hydroxymethylpyrimidine kinase / phosphomethylpyrimidine kinase / thiamine-phosphate diphosphorylase